MGEMMKKIITIIFILALSINIFAVTEIDSDIYLNPNPAAKALNEKSEFYFPGITFDLSLANSLISLGDVSIFQEDRVMTEADKKLLTRKNLDIFYHNNTAIFKLAIKNFEVDYSLISNMNLQLLHKEFAKLILYGNSEDEYSVNNSEGSIGYVFSKTKFSYAYPKSVNLSFIPEINTHYEALEKSVNFIRELPLYFGANVNFYYPFLYGEVVKSRQNFGSTFENTYANYDLQLLYTDITGKYKIKKSLTAGVGFGMMADFNKGKFFIDFDDIFAGLSYKDLVMKEYQGAFVDTLTHLDSDYEFVSNDTTITNTQNRKKKISNNFSTSIEYNFYKNYVAKMEYKKSKYSYPNGFNVEVRNKFFHFFPTAFKIGRDEVTYYQFTAGLNFQQLQFYTSLTTYGGFFNYSKGIGVKFMWIHKF